MKTIHRENSFLGRQKILNALHKRVVDLKDGYRYNVALLGNRYVGKSSILHNFMDNLNDDDITVVYLDLEHKDVQYLFNKFVGTLLYNFSKNKKLPLYTEIPLLIESTKEILPCTIQLIEEIAQDLKAGKMNDFYLGLLALPQLFTNETQTFCILILDEFHCLENFELRNAFVDLGKKVMTQKKCLYMFASSKEAEAERILSDKLSLLFGNFEMLNIENFSTDESRNFICKQLEGVQVAEQLINFLIDFTGGHPLYLHLMSRELFNLSVLHKQNEIFLPILSQAAEDTMFNSWGSLNRHFECQLKELCSGKSGHIVSSLLLSLAKGKNKYSELVEDTKFKKNLIKQKINFLVEEGIVVKNRSIYYVKDKLLKYWILNVYQKRFVGKDLFVDQMREEFSQEFLRLFESFVIQSQKDFSSRMFELLNSFNNDTIDINGRRYSLPQFDHITPLKLQDEHGVYFDVLKAKANEETWLIVMKKDFVAENDINYILSESKKICKKPKRCVIVSSDDFGGNARLRGLQEKCWLWNRGEVNTLLNLFNKPFIL